MERKYVSLNKLSHFLSKLRTIFSDINHTHTVVDIENLSNTLNNMQSDVDDLEQTVANLAEEANNNKLPIVTSDNEGDFLMVVNGAWATSTIPNAEEASF